MTKIPVAGLLPDEIGILLKSRFPGKEPPAFRVKQIYGWICSGVSSFDEMTNLPAEMRKNLDENFSLRSSSVTAKLKDRDGTMKLQISLEDENRVEAVLLRDGKDRKTACLSVQAGCASGCVFCRTAMLGFKRNLLAEEIAGEFLFLNEAAADGKSRSVSKSGGESGGGISHIVFMGMGEPLLNLENVRKAVAFFCDKDGLNISRRRITLSTCGIISGLNEFTENGPDIRLALSIVSARENLRRRLMPAALSNPLPELKESLIRYQKKRRRRITLEAVLLRGINTGKEDAEALEAFAGGLDTIINLIPWNPVAPPYPSTNKNASVLLFDGKALETPERGEAENFEAALKKRGLKVTRRFEKGSSISGACGQLGS